MILLLFLVYRENLSTRIWFSQKAQLKSEKKKTDIAEKACTSKSQKDPVSISSTSL